MSKMTEGDILNIYSDIYEHITDYLMNRSDGYTAPECDRSIIQEVLMCVVGKNCADSKRFGDDSVEDIREFLKSTQRDIHAEMIRQQKAQYGVTPSYIFGNQESDYEKG